MKESKQDLWACNCRLQPQHPIPSCCAKEVNAAPWGLGSHHHPLSFHPYFSPPAWSESSGYRSHSGLLLISFLSLSLYPNIPTLSIPQPLLPYLWGERGRVARSQRQTAHPSITPASSLRCWVLSSTTQLLPSIKTYRWARMHTHKRLSQTHLSRPVDVSVPIYICNAHRKSPYQAAHVSESMRTHPRSDGVAERSAALFPSHSQMEMKTSIWGWFTQGKSWITRPLPCLFPHSSFLLVFFHPLLCTHRRDG